MSDDRQGSLHHTVRPALSIRARLMVLAAIVLVPLMLDRIRGIEIDRAERINAANQQALALVHQGVDAQREIVISARAFLQAAARAHAAFRWPIRTAASSVPAARRPSASTSPTGSIFNRCCGPAPTFSAITPSGG